MYSLEYTDTAEVFFTPRHVGQRFSNCGTLRPGALLVLWWGALVVCVRDILNFNGIWGKVKICILVGTLLR
jgi:hypothetical protein